MDSIIKTIIFKELKSILKNKRFIVSIGLFILVWLFISLGSVVSTPIQEISNLNGNLLYLTTALSVLVVYMGASSAFLLEKRNKTLETVLTSPVSVKNLWQGKVLGISLFAYLSSLLISIIVILFIFIAKGILFIPTISIILYIIFIAPLIYLAVSSILGYFEFLLGMKENRIINFITLFLVFGFLGSINALNSTIGISIKSILLIVLISLFIFVLFNYLIKFVSKEKIILSISEEWFF